MLRAIIGGVQGASERIIQVGLLGEALDAGPVGIFLADETMRYIAVNRYACDLLGYERAELLGLRVADVAPTPEDSAAYQEMIAVRELTGTTVLIRKDGATLDVRYRAVETEVAGMVLYVSVVWPAAGDPA